MKRVTRARTFQPVIRAALVVTAVVVLAGGVTYAALQSQQATLTGNTIQTANADLQLSLDGTNYADSQPGFAFGGLVPGGRAMPTGGYTFFLKNAGGTPLSLKLAASSAITNPDAADLSKVHVIVTDVSSGKSQDFPLQTLEDSAANGGSTLTDPAVLFNGSRQFTVQVGMDSDAVNGPGATISNVDLSFTGVAVN